MVSEYAKRKIAEYLAAPGKSVHPTRRIESPDSLVRTEPKYREKARELHQKWAARWADRQKPKKRACRKAYRRSQILAARVAAPPRASYPVAPYKYPVNTSTCTYCGYTSNGFDHIIPYKYIGRLSHRARRGGSDSGDKVPCCRECNIILGDRLVVTVVDRAAYLLRQKKVQKRYSIERLEFLTELASHS